MLYAKKRAKIVATIGPVTESEEMLEKLVHSGLNVARLNMSHGDHEEHGVKIKNIRAVAKKLDAPLSILFDLSGPKIRTGNYTTERINIEAGKQITLTSEEMIGDETKMYINYPKLPQEVQPGNIILLDDGKKKLQVVSISGNEILCDILVGGELKSRRGVNVPGAYLTIDTITDKDRKDLTFGLKMGVDMVALSFVRRASDVVELRQLMEKAGSVVPIIVKLETQEAIENLDAILREADGAMVARGDLAVEVPTEMVPLYQKDIIDKCKQLGKPVIVATQMLESMIHSPVPTRAEVSDIANAINDGADAVMLSEESTLGEYPLEAVQMMTRIAGTMEWRQSELDASTAEKVSIQDSISESVVQAARAVDAKAIVIYTETGSSAQRAARFRPSCPIIAFTPRQKTVQRLALIRGVYPELTEEVSSLDQVVDHVKKFVEENEIAQAGDKVVVTAGLQFGMPGSTNMLLVLKI